MYGLRRSSIAVRRENFDFGSLKHDFHMSGYLVGSRYPVNYQCYFVANFCKHMYWTFNAPSSMSRHSVCRSSRRIYSDLWVSSNGQPQYHDDKSWLLPDVSHKGCERQAVAFIRRQKLTAQQLANATGNFEDKYRMQLAWGEGHSRGGYSTSTTGVDGCNLNRFDRDPRRSREDRR